MHVKRQGSVCLHLHNQGVELLVSYLKLMLQLLQRDVHLLLDLVDRVDRT
jgi:hypothetical protein